MNGDTLEYINPLINALKNQKGKMVLFVGNEVNLPNISMAPKLKIFKRLNRK